MEQVTTRQLVPGYEWGTVRERLVERFLAAREAFAPELPNQAILTSLTLPLNADLQWFTGRMQFLNEGANQFSWSSPHGNLRLLGYGTAETIIVRGTERFLHLKKHLRTLQSRWFYRESDRPKLLGGFAFQPGPRQGPWEGWEDGRFLLPRFLVEVDAHQNTFLTISVQVAFDRDASDLVEDVMSELHDWLNAPASVVSDTDMRRETAVVSQPDVQQDGWEDIVRFLATQISAGDNSLHKVVLARRQTLHWSQPMALASVMARLQQTYPESHVFSVCRPFGCFVGEPRTAGTGCSRTCLD